MHTVNCLYCSGVSIVGFVCVCVCLSQVNFKCYRSGRTATPVRWRNIHLSIRIFYFYSHDCEAIDCIFSTIHTNTRAAASISHESTSQPHQSIFLILYTSIASDAIVISSTLIVTIERRPNVRNCFKCRFLVRLNERTRPAMMCAEETRRGKAEHIFAREQK